MKEKTAGYFLLAIAIIIALSVFNISLNIIKHSFYTGTLIWGVLAVLIIWIITIFISGMAMMILNYFHIGPFRAKALNDLLLSHVRIYGKKAKTNDKIVIVTMRNIVLIAIISIAIMIYSSYAGSLLWGIMIVILMIILLSVMSVFILLVKARI